MGVLRCVQQPTYDDEIHEQIASAVKTKGAGSLEKLFASDDLWEIKPPQVNGQACSQE